MASPSLPPDWKVLLAVEGGNEVQVMQSWMSLLRNEHHDYVCVTMFPSILGSVTMKSASRRDALRDDLEEKFNVLFPARSMLYLVVVNIPMIIIHFLTSYVNKARQDSYKN